MIARREFITLLGGAAALAARGAGAAGRKHAAHRCAYAAAADDPEGRPAWGRFCRGCCEFGWTTGPKRDSISLGRWAMPSDIRRYAAELAALAPDVILASGEYDCAALQQSDPHGANRVHASPRSGWSGFVDSLARPGGNVTGFTVFEYGMAGNGWSYSKRSHRA